MFKHYLVMALRNILRHKTFSLINIAGLAIGLACSMLAFLYVWDELNFDKFHSKQKQIYRLQQKDIKTGQFSSWYPPPLKGLLLNRAPWIRRIVRLSEYGETNLAIGPNHFLPENLLLADPEFLEIFDFPLIQGNPKTALSNPHSVVLTEKAARKYFGINNPIGKIIRIQNEIDLQITGVLKDIPANSHLQFDFLASLESLRGIQHAESLERWDWYSFQYYLQISTPAEIKKTESILAKIKKDILTSDATFWQLQPLSQVHLYSSNGLNEFIKKGDIRYVYGFSFLALLTFLVACFNYMNLANAMFSLRSKEISLKKAMGASRLSVLCQFLSESFLITLFSMLLGIVFVELSLPYFNNLMTTNLQLNFTSNILWLVLMVFSTVLVSILAGFYPAWLISRFCPIETLKASETFSKLVGSRISVRNFFVTLQLAISIGIIVCLAVVTSQMHYIKNAKLGIKKEKLLVVDNPFSKKMNQTYESYKILILNHPKIKQVSCACSVPPYPIETWGGVSVLEHPEIKIQNFLKNYIEQDYLKVLGAEFIAGRDFSVDFSNDQKAIVINETAAKIICGTSVIGKTLQGGEPLKIIGVVKDIHFSSMHQKVEPAGFIIAPPDYSWCKRIIIRTDSSDIVGLIGYLEDTWKKIAPDRPFQYWFVDEAFNKLYQSEQQINKLLKFFSGVALFISCIGIFGLATFATLRRSREIGIRKVLGATITQILWLLSREFSWLALAANLLAWPIAWYVMNKWLEDFAYHINLSWWSFALAGIATWLLTLATISVQACKVAMTNPTKSLRNE